MGKDDKRVTVGVEELALSNAMTLTAIVELLEERGILKRVKTLQVGVQTNKSRV